MAHIHSACYNPLHGSERAKYPSFPISCPRPTGGGLLLDLIFIRAIFVLIVAGCAYYFRPLGAPAAVAAGGGILVALAIIFVEIRLKRISLPRLVGAALGAAVGVGGAFLLSVVLNHVNPNNSTTLHFFQLGLVI